MKRKKVKTCLTCTGGPRELPVTAFGVDASRRDGLNVKCKECVRRRQSERRQALERARRAGGRPPRPAPVRSSFVLPVAAGALQVHQLRDRMGAALVLGAIDQAGGVCSQEQILRFTAQQLRARQLRPVRHQLEDRVGAALGELFQVRVIATQGEADARVYFRRGGLRFKNS